MSAITVPELTRYYGAIRGVEDVPFGVDPGEVFGFLGPNGAGKTTLIRTLLGFVSPTAGTAAVLGHDIRDTAGCNYFNRWYPIVRLLGALCRYFLPDPSRNYSRQYEESGRLAAKGRLGYLPGDPAFDGDVTGRRFPDLQVAVKGDSRRVCDRVGVIRDGYLVELADVEDLLVSVLVSRESTASRGALGLVLGLSLVDSLATVGDVGWVGAVSPTRYFDPAGVLLYGEYDPVGALLLLGVAATAVALAVARFRRADIA